MLELLFEDSLHPTLKDTNGNFPDVNKVIILSKMLEHYLSNDYIQVLFSNSSNKLENLILTSHAERLLVYYDLVFDNPETIKKLTILFSKLISNEICNVAIVPIHCIEWHCIKSFGRDCEIKRIALNCEDYKNTKIYRDSMNPKKASHEKFCKAVMGEIVDKRFHGSCTLDAYTITRKEEEQLVQTLPVIFASNISYTSIVLRDFLPSYYIKFVELINCDTTIKLLFLQYLQQYLKLLNF